jgi:hypothetical protein
MQYKWYVSSYAILFREQWQGNNLFSKDVRVLFSDIFNVQLVDYEDIEPMHKWSAIFVYICVFPLKSKNGEWGSCLIGSVLPIVPQKYQVHTRYSINVCWVNIAGFVVLGLAHIKS